MRTPACMRLGSAENKDAKPKNTIIIMIYPMMPITKDTLYTTVYHLYTILGVMGSRGFRDAL